jgi:predicted adenine nucleotide alpha hydrolase (AANH) superfamily ATPase
LGESEIVRFHERLKLRQETEAKLRREEKRRKRNWKRTAGLPAFCYSCKKEMTYKELFSRNAGRQNPHGKNNRCEKCFDAELNSPADDFRGGENYAGEEIWWKLAP